MASSVDEGAATAAIHVAPSYLAHVEEAFQSPVDKLIYSPATGLHKTFETTPPGATQFDVQPFQAKFCNVAILPFTLKSNNEVVPALFPEAVPWLNL